MNPNDSYSINAFVIKSSPAVVQFLYLLRLNGFQVRIRDNICVDLKHFM
jgi:hypothetical protein